MMDSCEFVLYMLYVQAVCIYMCWRQRNNAIYVMRIHFSLLASRGVSLCRGSQTSVPELCRSYNPLINGLISWPASTSKGMPWLTQSHLLGCTMRQRPCEAIAAYGTEASSSSSSSDPTPDDPHKYAQSKLKGKREAIRSAINSNTDISEIINRQKGPR